MHTSKLLVASLLAVPSLAFSVVQGLTLASEPQCTLMTFYYSGDADLAAATSSFLGSNDMKFCSTSSSPNVLSPTTANDITPTSSLVPLTSSPLNSQTTSNEITQTNSWTPVTFASSISPTISSSVPSASTCASNLLQNANFASGTGGWTLQNPGASSLRALTFGGTTAGTWPAEVNGISYITSSAFETTATQYTIRAYFYADPVALTGSCDVLFSTNDGLVYYTPANGPSLATNTWVLYTFQVSTTATSTNFFNIKVECSVYSDIYLTNVEFYKAGTSCYSPPTGIPPVNDD